MSATESGKTTSPKAGIAKFLLVFIVFVAGGYLLGTWLAVNDVAVPLLPEMSISVIAAMTTAVIYVMMGLMVGVGAWSPKFGSRFLNVADAQELIDERGVLLSSALSMIMFGAALAIIALSAPTGPISAPVALISALVLMAAGIAVYLRTRTSIDELMQRVSLEATGVAYYMMFVIGGGWALLAHLGLIPGPEFLDWLTMFWAFALVGTFWSSGRRGMLADD